MSLHPSLKVDTAGSQERTVLSRIERIKDLMKKGLWEEGRRVTGLPKTKIVKLKTKKAPKEEKEGEEGATAETSAAPSAASPAASPAAKGSKGKE